MTASTDLQDRNKSIVIEMLERTLVRADPTVLDDHPGISETVALMARRAAAFPDLSLRVEHVIAEGDMVAYLVRLKGTHLGPFAGVPPTGRLVEYSGIGIDRLENGRVVEHHANPDFQAILTQIGAFPLQGR
jgi:predicted ester cyclase